MLPTLTPTDFVALTNQTLEITLPVVDIYGELANFRISKNKWVYFDLKDEMSSVKFFGTVYQLTGPLEDGMTVQVQGSPRLHNLYGFSVNILSLQPVGEGSIKKAATLLEAKLSKEGLFDPARKRTLPYPPNKIGLITSRESAAYHDFIKILNQRWGGLEVLLADVQVQGADSPMQIVRAVEYFNMHEEVDVIVITRGGGSADDLVAFNTEQVTRAVAGSRAPTLVAIGHEVDVSLAELAADQRASTPSNAAELLVPDKAHELKGVVAAARNLADYLDQIYKDTVRMNSEKTKQLSDAVVEVLAVYQRKLSLSKQILQAFDPLAILKRGYAVVKKDGKIIKSKTSIKPGDKILVSFADGETGAQVL